MKDNKKKKKHVITRFDSLLLMPLQRKKTYNLLKDNNVITSKFLFTSLEQSFFLNKM